SCHILHLSNCYEDGDEIVMDGCIMPETYREIQTKAGAIGNRAFGHVRRGVAGEPNQFYAIESGRVVGTPFNLANVHDELARLIAQWGCTFLIMWSPDAQKGSSDGTD
ncbi:MAG: hypothetical protein ACT6UU_24400, partial [Hydrogenophaga sp.]|uniref:hypothetical protein n=1 Tax=Hydrogenophaga sp. TaxID=1904254 RepID=UPI004035645C